MNTGSTTHMSAMEPMSTIFWIQGVECVVIAIGTERLAQDGVTFEVIEL